MLCVAIGHGGLGDPNLFGFTACPPTPGVGLPWWAHHCKAPPICVFGKWVACGGQRQPGLWCFSQPNPQGKLLWQDHPFNDGPPEPLSSPAFATEYRFDATNKEGGVWKILRWEMQAHFTRQAIEVNGRVQGASSSVTDMELAKL